MTNMFVIKQVIPECNYEKGADLSEMRLGKYVSKSLAHLKVAPSFCWRGMTLRIIVKMEAPIRTIQMNATVTRKQALHRNFSIK